MKLHSYTTVYRYIYEDENIENFYYFCSDEYMPSEKEINEVKCNLEITDNDKFELFGHTANDFNQDTYLSDNLRLALTTQNTPQKYADLQLSYISTQNINKEDKIEIIKSLIKLYQEKCDFKQFRNIYKVNLYTLNRLLNTLDEKDEIKSTRRDLIVNQLKLILGYNNDEILLKLTYKENTKIIKHYLDKLEHLYNIKEETSQYRIAIILMLFIERCNLLLPTIQGKLSVASNLIAKYYGIKAPTYRRNVLYNFVDKNNPSKPLYKNIIHEQEEFWEKLKR